VREIAVAGATTAGAVIGPKLASALTFPSWVPDAQWFTVAALLFLVWMIKRMINRFEQRLIDNSEEHRKMWISISKQNEELARLKGEHDGLKRRSSDV